MTKVVYYQIFKDKMDENCFIVYVKVVNEFEEEKKEELEENEYIYE